METCDYRWAIICELYFTGIEVEQLIRYAEGSTIELGYKALQFPELIFGRWLHMQVLLDADISMIVLCQNAFYRSYCFVAHFCITVNY